MANSKPKLVAINHDDYHAEHIGRTSEGCQFFLTNPFEPEIGKSKGCEYVALFLFDNQGDLTEAKIDSFGPREKVNEEKRRKCYEQRLRELGDVTFERIEVKPFAVDRFGTTFGLVPREPEDEDDEWGILAHTNLCRWRLLTSE